MKLKVSNGNHLCFLMQHACELGNVACTKRNVNVSRNYSTMLFVLEEEGWTIRTC